MIEIELGLGFAQSFVTGKEIFFSEKHNADKFHFAAVLSFSQMLFQTNSCFIGVNLL